ncbi:MAG: pyridoxamine 5'-phosphate oxidase family protein [Proteobacteria bacterium]|nr:pyridoxamine 5'-phosphate oxidase family protein [Pseudomonadota bacterium]
MPSESTLEDFEEVHVFPLDEADGEKLLTTHNECVFMWGTRDHWPVGVIMSYVWRDGRFWLTATSQRKRIAAVRRDPRVSVVVTSTGTKLGPNRTITAKGHCTLHDDAETKAWFYPALGDALFPKSPHRDAFVEMLDSPRRLVLEVKPEKWITYDGPKMFAAAGFTA